MGIRELLEASASGAYGDPDLEDDAAFEGSPLADLTFTERHVVHHVERPYEALGIALHATQAEVRTAFREKAKASHPDINPGDASAAARMLEVNQAYEVLGNPKLRAAFDWLQKDGQRL
jgi:DnaJ-class molecular chaperone